MKIHLGEEIKSMYNSLLFLSASSPGKICEQSQSLVIKGSVCLWLSPAGMGTLLVKHQDGQSKRTRQERTETSLLWFWANFVRSCPQGNAQTETQQFPAVFFHPALRWDSSRTFSPLIWSTLSYRSECWVLTGFLHLSLSLSDLYMPEHNLCNHAEGSDTFGFRLCEGVMVFGGCRHVWECCWGTDFLF